MDRLCLCPTSQSRYRATAPLVGEPLAYRRVFVDRRFATAGPAGVTFCLAADDDFGAEGESIEKMNLLPRPPLLGEVASSEAMMTERFNLQMPYSRIAIFPQTIAYCKQKRNRWTLL